MTTCYVYYCGDYLRTVNMVSVFSDVSDAKHYETAFSYNLQVVAVC